VKTSLIRFTVLLIALVMLNASPATAEMILGTETEGNGGYGVGFSFDPEVNLVIGQQFTLNQDIIANSITLYLNGDGSDSQQSPMTLQLMNAIGFDATASNVLGTWNALFPSGTPDGEHAPRTFDGLNVPLPAGTYYLVVSSPEGYKSGWGTGAELLPSSFGSVGSAFVGIAGGGGVADYTFLATDNPQDGHANFVLEGVIPEPATWLLAAVGVGGVMLLARRKYSLSAWMSL